jgi:hypothetical protein
VRYVILMCEILYHVGCPFLLKHHVCAPNIKVYYKYIICISKIYSFECDLTKSLRCELKLYIYFYHICKQMLKFMFGTPFHVITYPVCTIHTIVYNMHHTHHMHHMSRMHHVCGIWTICTRIYVGYVSKTYVSYVSTETYVSYASISTIPTICTIHSMSHTHHM